MSKERIQELCDYIDRNKVRRHLIDNTKLKEQPDHVVHSYFKMLAVILQAGIPETAQIHFFQRLVLP